MSTAPDRTCVAGGLVYVVASVDAHVGDLLTELDGLGFVARRIDLAASAWPPTPPTVALVVGEGDRATAFARGACAALAAHPLLTGVPVVVVLPAGRIAIADPALDAHELIVRPLRAGELLSRIDRASAAASGRAPTSLSLRCGALRLDPCGRRVWIDGHPVAFSVREFELLSHLARNPTSVHSRTHLLSVVWDSEAAVGTRAVDVLVRRVRAKLGDELSGCIRTVRRVGYAFTAPS